MTLTSLKTLKALKEELAKQQGSLNLSDTVLLYWDKIKKADLLDLYFGDLYFLKIPGIYNAANDDHPAKVFIMDRFRKNNDMNFPQWNSVFDEAEKDSPLQLLTFEKMIVCGTTITQKAMIYKMADSPGQKAQILLLIKSSMRTLDDCDELEQTIIVDPVSDLGKLMISVVDGIEKTAAEWATSFSDLGRRGRVLKTQLFKKALSHAGTSDDLYTLLRKTEDNSAQYWEVIAKLDEVAKTFDELKCVYDLTNGLSAYRHVISRLRMAANSSNFEHQFALCERLSQDTANGRDAFANARTLAKTFEQKSHLNVLVPLSSPLKAIFTKELCELAGTLRKLQLLYNNRLIDPDQKDTIEEKVQDLILPFEKWAEAAQSEGKSSGLYPIIIDKMVVTASPDDMDHWTQIRNRAIHKSEVFHAAMNNLIRINRQKEAQATG